MAARSESGFDKAYDETHLEYPCFGAVHDVSAKDWWRRCIIRSFEIAREDAVGSVAPEQRVDALEDALLLVRVQRGHVRVRAGILARDLKRSDNASPPPVFGGHVVHGAEAGVLQMGLVIRLIKTVLDVFSRRTGTVKQI